jgi:hypothetical protein
MHAAKNPIFAINCPMINIIEIICDNSMIFIRRQGFKKFLNIYNYMALWILSFFTGIIIIISLYFALQLANIKLRVSSVIVLLLLMVGETFDVLAELVLNQLLLLVSETIELFAVLGFFTIAYYIYEKKEKLAKKRKKRKK